LGFSAFSGTGKTTLIIQLIKYLKQKNIRLAYLKHGLGCNLLPSCATQICAFCFVSSVFKVANNSTPIIESKNNKSKDLVTR
jgi:GTPase SAR1 family protein